MSTKTTTLLRDELKTEKVSTEVVDHLQRQVANAFVLYANYKHYHWETYGPHFRELHMLFDEFANLVLPTADEFAERLRFKGEAPVFDLRQMLDVSNLHSSIRGETMLEMIQEAHANVLLVISDMRLGAKAADAGNDPGSVDLFSKTVQVHEKHEWVLRELLRKNDGLTR
jgi:starvation-inducible DNA-binding protein